jgi:preprotein translocase subunit SecY
MSSEIVRRIAFTVCALLVYRLGSHIPIPGIDPVAWRQIFRHSGGILGMVDVVSGGAVQHLSIFAIGITPFISAAILIQLLIMVGAPALGQLRKAGERGRKVIHLITLCLTVLLVAFQSYGISVALEGFTGLVSEPGLLFRLSAAASLTGGTIFLIWLCELITVRGAGNGLALLLFVAIVTQMPVSISAALEAGREGVTESNLLLLLSAALVVMVALIVAIEKARRLVPVEFTGRQAGMPTRTSNLSLKLNSAGVIPTVLASWFLTIALFGASLAGRFDEAWATTVARYFGPRTVGFMVASTIAIVVFSFIYTAFVLDPEEAAEKLDAYGGAIPGIAPGEATAAHLDLVVSRTTILGAAYLALIALIPELLIAYANVPFYFGGVSALVVVCVVLDISAQIGAQVREDGRANTGG